MPTYDYRCDACGHTFEEFQRMSEEPLQKCPQCKKKKLKRLIGTGAAIIFKGSGFYQTDYRSESYKSAAKADAAPKPAASDAGRTTDTAGTSGTGDKPAGKSGGKNAKSEA